MKALTKLQTLSDIQLIELSKELQQSIIPDNALIREVIKDSEWANDSSPHLAFIGIGSLLTFVLAERLEAYVIGN